MSLDSVFRSFKPIFYVSQALGTMPLRFKKKPYEMFERWWLAYAYSFLLFLITCVHGLSTPYFSAVETKISISSVSIEVPTNMSDYVSFMRNQTSVQMQMVAMKLLNPLIAVFMALGPQMVSFTLVAKDLPTFMAKLSDVDSILNMVLVRDAQQDFRITLTILIYFFLLSIPVNVFYLIFFPFRDFVWNFWLSFDSLVSFVSEIQFVCLASYLRSRFREINYFLKNHRGTSIPSNFFSIYKNMVPMKRDLTLRKVELLHRSNIKLCGLMKDLNRLYQFQLLCSIAGCFIKLLFNIYFGMFGPYTSSLYSSNHISKVALWTVFYFFRFIITTIIASSTTNETLKTKSLVAQVISRDLSSEIKEELNIFLNHATNWTMSFSACGLFTIDTTLITSALGAGTTYLVILVQFRPQI